MAMDGDEAEGQMETACPLPPLTDSLELQAVVQGLVLRRASKGDSERTASGALGEG